MTPSSRPRLARTAAAATFAICAGGSAANAIIIVPDVITNGDYHVLTENRLLNIGGIGIDGAIYTGDNFIGEVRIAGSNGWNQGDTPIYAGGGDFNGGLYTSVPGQALIQGDFSGRAETHAPANAANTTVKVGGSFGGSDPDGIIQPNQGFLDIELVDFNAIKDFSLAVAGMGSDLAPVDSNNLTFAGSGDLTIINTSLDALGAADTLSYILQPDEILLINVSGNDGAFNAECVGDCDALAGNVLYNFYEANMFDVNSAFFGSLLAPVSTLNSNNTIKSTIMGTYSLNNLSGGISYAESRLDFSGLDNAPAVPLPASVLLLGVGVAALRAARAFRP